MHPDGAHTALCGAVGLQFHLLEHFSSSYLQAMPHHFVQIVLKRSLSERTSQTHSAQHGPSGIIFYFPALLCYHLLYINMLNHLYLFLLSKIEGFPAGSDGKMSAYNAGDPGSIPGLGKSPGEGNGNPFQYSCLENPMDGGAW